MTHQVEPTHASGQNSTHAEDLKLVRQVLAGDSSAIDRFASYLARIPAILTFQRSRGLARVHDQEIPDFVQDCVSAIWRKLPEFEGRAALSTWIFTICSLEVRNSFRRWKKRAAERHEAHPEVASTQDHATQSAMRLDLREGLNNLPPTDREIVQRKHYEGQTFDEIAAALSLKPSQAKTHYYNSIRRLSDYLSSRNWEGEQT